MKKDRATTNGWESHELACCASVRPVMQTFFYLLDQNVVLEPAREVLPGLWVGKHSGTELEHLAREHRGLVLVDQKELRELSSAVSKRPIGQRDTTPTRMAS